MDSIKSPSMGEISSEASTNEPEIKVMPEKYVGAPLKAPPKPVEKVVVVEKVVEKKVPAPPAPARKAGFPKWAIAAIIILLIAGGGALYYTMTLTKPAPVAVAPPPPPPPPPPPAPPPPPPPSPPPPPEEKGPKAGADADSDGLTDLEEKLYGSDSANPDSDNDGFLDGVEVFHLYNPAGRAPVRLLDTGAVKVFSNPNRHYQIYYPSPWTVTPRGDEMISVKFSGAADDYIEVAIESNPDKLPLVNWYLLRYPAVKPSELQTFITKNNLDGVKSPERLIAYINADDFVYVISYRLGPDNLLNFRSTFEMMLNSFIRTR